MSANIVIHLNTQTLVFTTDTTETYTYPISTALNGAGEQQGSGCTPRGQHLVRAKIGSGLPLNSVFVGRRFTHEIYSSTLARAHPTRDWILTRILWLSGCVVGFNRGGNVDTMRRYIYIHGTPDTEPMRTPLSHGCIRMRNSDLIDFFNLVPAYCPVNIIE